jgi:glucuronoarabinoxylan endo-1,4-beta-xylanase
MSGPTFSRSALAAALLALSVAACIRRPAVPATPRAAPSPIAAVVTIAPGERHQTLEGFGASVAWHLETITAGAPPGIYQVLFPELGLDILRLRNRYGRSKPEDGDLGQEVEILRRGTAALGHPPKILLSSWSPPAALKADGHEDCHDNRDCTLAKEHGRFVYDKLARYWADSLRHYAELGIVPDYITIENEPSFIPPAWEGCKFEPSETADYPGFDRALEAVHDAIARVSLPRRPLLLAPEVLGIHWGVLQKYLAALNQSLVDGVAHHLYEKGPDGIWDWRAPGPDSFADPMRAAAAATRKPLYQTEFQTDDDRGIDGGLETAWLIHLSLVDEGVVAFLYWNLVWTDQGGLVSINRGRYQIRDQYYAVKHYARFTDPGDVRVGARSSAPAIRASAFVSPAGDRLTIVVLNTGAVSAELRIEPGGFSFARAAGYLTIFRPGASEVWKQLGALDLGRTLALPSRSIATFVLTR